MVEMYMTCSIVLFINKWKTQFRRRKINLDYRYNNDDALLFLQLFRVGRYFYVRRPNREKIVITIIQYCGVCVCICVVCICYTWATRHISRLSRSKRIIKKNKRFIAIITVGPSPSGMYLCRVKFRHAQWTTAVYFSDENRENRVQLFAKTRRNPFDTL